MPCGLCDADVWRIRLREEVLYLMSWCSSEATLGLIVGIWLWQVCQAGDMLVGHSLQTRRWQSSNCTHVVGMDVVEKVVCAERYARRMDVFRPDIKVWNAEQKSETKSHYISHVSWRLFTSVPEMTGCFRVLPSSADNGRLPGKTARKAGGRFRRRE